MNHVEAMAAKMALHKKVDAPPQKKAAPKEDPLAMMRMAAASAHGDKKKDLDKALAHKAK